MKDVEPESQAPVTKVHFRLCSGKMLLQRLFTTCLGGGGGGEGIKKKEEKKNHSDYLNL